VQSFQRGVDRIALHLDLSSSHIWPGTAVMPWSAPEYDHDILKPIAYDLDLARQYMQRAGYTY
jgi:hypothetical protein